MTGSQTYSFSYPYNLAGSITSETYPSGRVVTTGYDGANRENNVGLSGSPGHYATGFAYWPTDALQLFTAGNGLFSSRGYNGKLQPACDMVGSGTLPAQGCQDQGGSYLTVLTYNWGTTNNNGNLQSATEGYGSKVPYGSLSLFNQTYYPNYDGVNRLTSVSDSGGYSRSFGYDQFGNMWITTSGGITPAGNAPTGAGSYNSKNQITTGSATFDAAGNQTFANGNSLTYDAENRQISETDGTTKAVTNYIYDGDGRRVEKIGPSATVVYVYDVRGVLASEYSTATNNSTCTTCYLFWDHLGTIRLVADQNGSIIGRHDYLPFGEEILAGSAGRPASQMFGGNDYINQKFTAKERDSESGLDYFGARYYGAALGRFTSPDWSEGPDPIPYADLSNPQTLNLYSYVKNNPLSLIDDDGHCWSWLQGVCNVFQDLGNFLRGAGWITNDELDRRRSWLEEHAANPDSAKAAKKLSPADVSRLYNCGQDSQCVQAQNSRAEAQRQQTAIPLSPAPWGPKPRLTNNPKHNPNSASPEPANVQELFDNSIEDSRGVRWAKDAEGNIHRFSRPSNGETHWNGSTEGPNGIRMDDIPIEVRRALK